MVSIYQHFREEEHSFIDQVLTWKEAVERSYITKQSDFLDPREQHIAQSILGKNNEVIHWGMDGGVENAERKRLMMRPFYESLDRDVYSCELLQATYNEKYMSLSHRDVLGAFLSLGLDRSKLGDVHVADGKIQMIIAAEISPYILANFTSVRKANVTFETKDLSSWSGQQEEWMYADKVISSKRLDVVVKEMYHIPRKEA